MRHAKLHAVLGHGSQVAGVRSRLTASATKNLVGTHQLPALSLGDLLCLAPLKDQ
jgi:hypothetical protein